MKKLLLLVLSLIISFNSYGQELTSGSWSKLFEYEGTSWWLNLERIQERDGLVYYWYLSSDDKESRTVLSENDCMLSRAKVLQNVQYDKPMMEGEAIYLPTDDDWIYFPPDSIGETLQYIACDIAPLSLEERERDMRAFQSFVEEEITYTDEEVIQAVKYAEEQAETSERGQWVNSVVDKVTSNWRYQGADDDWTAEVYVVQDRDGTIVAVDVRNSNVGDSQKAKVFQDSIRRAVYKSSPLPRMGDAFFDREFLFIFNVNN